MDKALKEKRQDIKKAQQDVEVLKNQKEEFTLKFNSLKKEVTIFESEAELAEKEKTEILSLHAIGQASEAELRHKRESLENAQKKLRETRELLNAVTSVKSEADSKLLQLNVKLRDAEISLWRTIYEDLKAKNRTAISDILLPVYVAKLKSGLHGRMETALKDIIPFEPGHDVLQKIQTELENEYIK